MDGRAQDAARYPDGVCKAIYRGFAKDKLQQVMHLRAVLEVGEGVHKRVVDPEEFHEVDECPTTQWFLDTLSEGRGKEIGCRMPCRGMI